MDPASTTVDAGSSVTVRLRLRNTGDVVDEYRFVPVGDIAPYTTVEPQTLRLYPNTTGTVELTVAPPRTPDAAAGPHPYGVQIVPTEYPEAITVPEGNLTVTPFTEVRAELVPPTVKGRFRGRPQLAVDNLGNVKLTASIDGSDNGDQFSYQLQPANIQVEPGRAAFVKTTLKPRQIVWAGAKQTRPFTLTVQRSGAEPVPVEGSYVQRSVLPRWVAMFCTVFLALAIAFVMVWISYKPSVKSRATAKQAGSSALPKPTPSQSSPSALPKPKPSSPSAPPSKADDSKSDDGGGDGDDDAKKSSPPKRWEPKKVLLYNMTNEMCADIPGTGPGEPGTHVNQAPCIDSEDDNQLWNFHLVHPKKGPGGKDLYVISNDKDGQCLDLPGTRGKPPGTKVQEAECNRLFSENQLWWLESHKQGGKVIHNYASNQLCLEVEGDRVKDSDTPLTLLECDVSRDKQWKFPKKLEEVQP